MRLSILLVLVTLIGATALPFKFGPALRWVITESGTMRRARTTFVDDWSPRMFQQAFHTLSKPTENVGIETKPCYIRCDNAK